MSRLGAFLRSPGRVLATALAAAVAFSGLWVVRSNAGAPAPVPVPEQAVGTAGGATWQLDGIGVVETMGSGSSTTEPVPGAVFVVARFRFRSDDPELYCSVRLVGDRREWTTLLHLPADPDTSAGCDGRPDGTAEVAFQIPAAAVAEVQGVEIAAGEESVLLAGRPQ
jgi:hypothetical protein